MSSDKAFPFQEEGAAWLSKTPRALLCDEPGLGKTNQLVRAADMIGARTILATVPAGIVLQWAAQIERWSFWGHDIHIVADGQSEPRKGHFNIVSYDLLSRGFLEKKLEANKWLKKFGEINWDLVLCDEFHKLKDSNSLRTLAVLSDKGKIAQRAKRLWMASGTPMPRHPGELWTSLTSVGATEMSLEQFEQTFCQMKWTGYEHVPHAALDEKIPDLIKLMEPYMTRRQKKLVMPQLPELQVDDFPVIEVPIKLEEFFEDAAYKKKWVEEKIKEEENFVRAAWQKCIASDGAMKTYELVALLDDMKDGVAMYRRWLGAVKAASMIDQVYDELDNDPSAKIVLFCFHHQVINFMAKRLQKFGVCVIDGGTPVPQRMSIVQESRKPDGPRVAVIQIIAAGEGLDGLQHAFTDCIVVEPFWTPHINVQAILRLHRIGQRSRVWARMARLAGTLDDYINKVLVIRARQQSEIFDAPPVDALN